LRRANGAASASPPKQTVRGPAQSQAYGMVEFRQMSDQRLANKP